ncbi:MAG: molybdopterin cofactor-binding domain-containing protein [Steroidobacteraceae bacterium]
MITRRQLLIAGAAVGGGLFVGFSPQLLDLKARLLHAPPLGEPGWIRISRDGSVRLYCTLTEMGQGVWSALAQIVNEELEADPDSLRVEMAPTWRAYGAPVGFGTGGSTAVERMFTPMRRIGAATRILLVEAGASRWKAASKDCRASAGYVIHDPSGRRLPYAALAPLASSLRVNSNPPLKPRAAWHSIGRSLPRLDAPSKVNGTARFGLDVHIDGMLIAAVSQSPWPGARPESVDRQAALRQPGVVRLIELDDTVAVLATDSWGALRGLQAASVSWQVPEELPDTEQLRTALLAKVDAAPSAELSPSGRWVSATYDVPLLMHAQLEPLNATAHVHRFGADLWAPTQQPALLQEEVAKALFIVPQAVTVHTTLVGGGFGRRLIVAEGVTAARIAEKAGVPVKAIWSREEDSTQDDFRPMAAARLEASLDAAGKPQGFSARIASLGQTPRTSGLDPTPYRLRDAQVQYFGFSPAIRVGYWRSVDASQNAFFRESFLDECAYSAGIDPLQYRLELLGAGHARGKRVLAALGEACGWTRARRPDRFLGLAYNEGFRSISAQAVELSRSEAGALRIERIVVVVDCGTAVNPGNIRAQIEGGALFALSAALREEAILDKGRLKQRNFDSYPVLRMANARPVEVHILESPESPIGGMGEVAVPPLAPALANALFAATGVRIRRLPLSHAALNWA